MLRILLFFGRAFKLMAIFIALITILTTVAVILIPSITVGNMYGAAAPPFLSQALNGAGLISAAALCIPVSIVAMLIYFTGWIICRIAKRSLYLQNQYIQTYSASTPPKTAPNQQTLIQQQIRARQQRLNKP